MFTLNNFLLRLNGLITGQSNGQGSGVGFLKTMPIHLTELKTTAGLTLTGATAPLVAALETYLLGVQWAASNATAALLIVPIPYDYDEITDKIIINMQVNSAGNTDNPTMSAVVYNKRVGTAVSANLAPSASSAIPKSATAATAAANRTITISGKGIKGGDTINILLSPSAHTSDAVNLYSLAIQYYSTLVAFDPNLR